MPVDVGAELRCVSQAEFVQVVYDTMGVLFSVHNEMGRLFREDVYKVEVARRLGKIEIEVPIYVSFDGFGKRYRIDMLVGGCAVFEIKTARYLTPNDRAQLMHYLLLTGLPRGKLVNLRPVSIEHEFVNVVVSRDDRVRFIVDDSQWKAISKDDACWKGWLVEAIRDWGAGLELSLYTYAVVHVLGGVDRVKRKIEVFSGDHAVGLQEVLLTGLASILKVTALDHELVSMEIHLKRFLEHTRLEAIQWVNVTRRQLTFRTLMRGGGSVI